MAGNLNKWLPGLLLVGVIIFHGCCKDCKFPLENLDNPLDIRLYPADDYNNLFTRFGGGWTGGQGGYSLKLSDGRVLWLFWETILDTVYDDRTRPETAPMIDNSILIQEGNNLTTLYGGTEESPIAYLIPPESELKYYPLSAIETDGSIQVVCAALPLNYPSYYVYSGGKHIDVVSLSKDDFSVTNIARKLSNSFYLFGAGLLKDGDYIYIYGPYEDGMKYARTASGGLLNQWEYERGDVWVTDPAYAYAYSFKVRMPHVINTFKKDDAYYILGNNDDNPFLIYLLKADGPTAFWNRDIYLFDLFILPKEHLSYEPVMHPDLSSPEQLLVSFNVRGKVGSYTDADAYTVYFIRIENIW